MAAAAPPAACCLLLMSLVVACTLTLAAQFGRVASNRWHQLEEQLEGAATPFVSATGRQFGCGRAPRRGAGQQQLSTSLLRRDSTAKYRPIEISRAPRIIGGHETAPGEFPWAVSIKLNGQPICGGSLIERQWILTAAHCVVGYNPRNLTVRLGAYRIKDAREPQTLESAVAMFIVHKHYSMPRPFSNDIALLKLAAPVEFTDFILPVCLPQRDAIESANEIDSDLSGGHETDSMAGIVISTKMSDKEIAKCFHRLEQNYLNSIGLGTTAASINVDQQAVMFADLPADQQQQQPQVSRPHHSLSTYETLANSVALGASFHQQQQQQQQPGQRHQQQAAIKLTSLPISKELLHEIQSVGSMPSLALDLPAVEFESMANDLAKQYADGGSSSSSHHSTGYAADSENQVISNAHRRSVRAKIVPVNANKLTSSTADDEPTKYSGLLGIVVGWGWVRENDADEQLATASSEQRAHQSVALQKVELPILRNDDCEAWFQSQSKKITLLPSQFCAGFNLGGKDACRGDSGGPMVIEDETDLGRYKLIGIVSAGIGCARPSLPGLYTRVASFLPWIQRQVALN